jgi:molecular chaperone HscB
MTMFERLGLPGRFSVDVAAVEREYLARSRAVHPDFHSLADAEQQAASLEDTAALNEAYLTLKDPFRRAEYLLRVLGGPTAQQEKNLDQAFLMEMMDFRERIEEAAGDRDTLTGLERELAGRLAAIVADLGRLFAADPPDLLAVRKRLNAAKTLQSLLRELRSEQVM